MNKKYSLTVKGADDKVLLKFKHQDNPAEGIVFNVDGIVFLRIPDALSIRMRDSGLLVDAAVGAGMGGKNIVILPEGAEVMEITDVFDDTEEDKPVVIYKPEDSTKPKKKRG